jgi:hypothetical protein
MRITATALLLLLTLGMLAQAEPRQSKERNHNYILRREEAGLVRRANDAPDHRETRDRHLPQRSDV